MITYCLAEDNRPRAQFKPGFCLFCGPTKLCGWRSVHIRKNGGIQAIINHLFLITSNPCHFPECVAVSLVCTKLCSVRAITPNSLCQMDKKDDFLCQSLKLMIHSLQEITEIFINYSYIYYLLCQSRLHLDVDVNRGLLMEAAWSDMFYQMFDVVASEIGLCYNESIKVKY